MARMRVGVGRGSVGVMMARGGGSRSRGLKWGKDEGGIWGEAAWRGRHHDGLRVRLVSAATTEAAAETAKRGSCKRARVRARASE